MVQTVKRVSVSSAVRASFFLSLIPAIVAMTVVMVIVNSTPGSRLSLDDIPIAIVAVVGVTVSSAFAVAVCVGVIAILYNISVRFSGGVKVYVDLQENPQESTPEKLKNLL